MPDDTTIGPYEGRRRFPGISSRAYEHPADRTALVAMRRLSGFDTVLKQMSGMVSERAIRLAFLAGSVRVGEQQFRRLYDMSREAAYTLDLPNVPELYVTQDPVPNAMAIGMDRPFIVVTSGLVELLDDDEMRTVIGHETGHILSGHAVYRTMLLILTRFASALSGIPLGSLGVHAIITALQEWFRKSELSCDRAGLLVGQDPEVSMRALMKVAGGSQLHEMSTDAFLEQAAEYEGAGDLRDSVLKLMNLLGRSHPYPVVRVAELRKWADGGEYARVLAGEYPHRDTDRDASVRAEAKASAHSYRESARTTTDPLFGLLRDLADGAADAGGKLRDRFAGRRDEPGARPAGGADGTGNGTNGGAPGRS